MNKTFCISLTRKNPFRVVMVLCLLACMFLSPATVNAQSQSPVMLAAEGDENWTDTFVDNTIFAPGRVEAMVVDGSDIYIAGGFTYMNGGSSINRISKWDHEDGQWHPLGSGLNGYVHQLAIDSSHNLYAYGSFYNAGGIQAIGLAKWDGTAWSALSGGGLAGTIHAIATIGNDLYVAGHLYFNGNFAAGIKKYDGTTWSDMVSGFTYDDGIEVSDGHIYTLISDGNDLYVGGLFTEINGIPAENIALWDGDAATPGWIGLSAGINDYVYALAVDSNQNLYAGGGFTEINGITVNHIAKYDGTWSALGNGLAGEVSDTAWINTIAVDGNNNLYVGGSFTSAGNLPDIVVPANKIAKWDAAAATWSGLDSGVNGLVNTSVVDENGDLYIGGIFTTAGSGAGKITAHSIAKWNAGTTTTIPAWSAPGSAEFEGIIDALTFDGNNLLAGGSFMSTGGVAANNVAMWNGTTWSALGAGIDGRVKDLLVDGGNLYAGGYSGTVARWDGANWSQLGGKFTHSDDFDEPVVNALAMYDGYLYAGGYFAQVGTTPISGIARLDPNAETPVWTEVGTGGVDTTGCVRDLLVGSDGYLYVAGRFSSIGGLTTQNIARWDGSTWSTLENGIEDYNGINSLAMSNDGHLYAAGYFTSGLAVWDGNLWSTSEVGLEYGSPYVIALDADGTVYAGGSTMIDGEVDNTIAKLEGNTWSNLGSGISGENYKLVNALVVKNNKLYVGGGFTSAGGKSMMSLAEYTLAINTPPVISSFTKTSPMKTITTISADDFIGAFTDADGDSLQTLKITALPQHGSLNLVERINYPANSTPVTLNQEIDLAALDVSGDYYLDYTPNTNYSGSDDFGWNGFDGKSYATSAAQVNLTIKPFYPAGLYTNARGIVAISGSQYSSGGAESHMILKKNGMARFSYSGDRISIAVAKGTGQVKLRFYICDEASSCITVKNWTCSASSCSGTGLISSPWIEGYSGYWTLKVKNMGEDDVYWYRTVVE